MNTNNTEETLIPRLKQHLKTTDKTARVDFHVNDNNPLNANTLINRVGDITRPEFRYVTITPEIAQDIIANRNSFNRRVKKNQVKYLDSLMNRSQFQPYNAETLKFVGDFETGRLIDGQHRLLGIITSGKTYEMAIATNVDESLFTTIDRGIGRSDGDMFEVQGIPNARNIASMISTYLKLDYRNIDSTKSNSIDNPLSKYKITTDQLFEVYYENDELVSDIYLDTFNKYKNFSILGPSKLAAMIFWTVKNSEFADRARTEFWEPLTTGENLDLSPNAKTCRNLFMGVANRKKQQKASDSYNTYMAWIIKAYNNHFIGKVLSESALMNLDTTGKSIALK